MNHNLAEHHVPVTADIDSIDVICVDKPDPDVTPPGVEGLGEIGIVGAAAAVANAIFHELFRAAASPRARRRTGRCETPRAPPAPAGAGATDASPGIATAAARHSHPDGHPAARRGAEPWD